MEAGGTGSVTWRKRMNIELHKEEASTKKNKKKRQQWVMMANRGSSGGSGAANGIGGRTASGTTQCRGERDEEEKKHQ